MYHINVAGYIRTVGITLLSWTSWHDSLPAAAFAEESCEALLSRMSHRCDVHRQLVGFESTVDLFLTLPPPSRALKSTRGALRDGLVAIFVGRLRSLLLSNGNLPFASPVQSKSMHSVILQSIPDDYQTLENKYKHISQNWGTGTSSMVQILQTFLFLGLVNGF